MSWELTWEQSLAQFLETADKELKLWNGHTTTRIMGLAQKRKIEVIKEEMIDETMRLHVFPS